VNSKLQKRQPGTLKEKTQYGLTFGVIAMMLFVANFPLVVIFFFGVFAYFLWKTFSSSPRNGIREIFKFYLLANAILRDDERKWFGFEVEEVIAHGEEILQTVHGVPPLVYFALGALYNKIGNHDSAVNHLSYVVENDSSDESTYVHPSAELRNYVKLLRKIEDDPTGAPQTLAAVRSLERARRNRGFNLLEDSRKKLSDENVDRQQKAHRRGQRRNDLRESMSSDSLLQTVNDTRLPQKDRSSMAASESRSVVRKKGRGKQKDGEKSNDEMFSNRKPITEVLHDIYDKNIQ